MKRGKNDIPGFANWYREYLNHREFVEFMGVGADTELAICLHAAIYEENRGLSKEEQRHYFAFRSCEWAKKALSAGYPKNCRGRKVEEFAVKLEEMPNGGNRFLRVLNIHEKQITFASDALKDSIGAYNAKRENNEAKPQNA